MKRIFCLHLVLGLGFFGQIKADDNFNSSPYSVIYTHLHYLQPNEYDPALASKAFDLKDRQEAEKLAIQLKQVLDGKGIFIKMESVPDKPDYMDTVQHRAIYILSSRLPQVYLEKRGDKWYYSKETMENIPLLHRIVYPFGSAVWVKLFPYKWGKHF